jgi:hypothetical protein
LQDQYVLSYADQVHTKFFLNYLIIKFLEKNHLSSLLKKGGSSYSLVHLRNGQRRESGETKKSKAANKS